VGGPIERGETPNEAVSELTALTGELMSKFEEFSSVQGLLGFVGLGGVICSCPICLLVDGTGFLTLAFLMLAPLALVSLFCLILDSLSLSSIWSSLEDA
jgi:hypothetical protein